MKALYDLRADGVAVIALDHPPVNTLSLVMRTRLMECLLAAEQESAVKAIVLKGRGDGFCAGGDLPEFSQGLTFVEPGLPGTLMPLIETLSKPVVAALHGYALGGGLELAMVCHARVVQDNCKVGLPETSLGLLPGAGGTQRLPRAVGLELATSLILGGQAVVAKTLAESGLFDEVTVDSPLPRACALALQLAGQGAPFPLLSRLQVKHPEPEGFLAFAALQAKGQRTFNSAMPKALLALSYSYKYPFEEGSLLEQELFRNQLQDSQSLAIRHAFLAERGASKVVGLNDEQNAAAINQAVVIGAGFMGSGIATCLARAGIAVRLYDSQPGAAVRAVERIAAQEKLEPSLLQVIEDYPAMAEADLIIEAVVEDLAVKCDLFQRLGQVAKAQAVLASNTSSLDLDAIAQASGRPSQVLGLHFFGPAQVMRLLEVVRGEQTRDEVLSQALTLARKLRKVAVVARVCPGFIGNRLFDRYLLQALALAEQGVDPQRIDRALERWGMRMGPFRVMDLVGNDLLAGAWRGRYEHSALSLLQRLVDEGRLGQKSGKGWYRYDEPHRASPDPQVLLLLPSASQVLDEQTIAERCVLALVNEGARVLEEGIAQRAADIDVVFLLGYGLAPHRGGPMHYASSLGLVKVQRKLRALAETTGDGFWQPAALIERLATEHQDFSALADNQ